MDVCLVIGCKYTDERLRARARAHSILRGRDGGRAEKIKEHDIKRICEIDIFVMLCKTSCAQIPFFIFAPSNINQCPFV